jgi:hypothetical protein
MPEHRIHITVADHGHDLDNGERFLAGFSKTHPEVGPSVSQNIAEGTLSVTFSLDAADADQALEFGRPIFVAGGDASGLTPTNIISVEAHLVRAEDERADEIFAPVSA